MGYWGPHLLGNGKPARSFSDRSFFMDVRAGCPFQNACFSSIWRAWPKFLAGCPQRYPAKNFLFGLNFRSWSMAWVMNQWVESCIVGHHMGGVICSSVILCQKYGVAHAMMALMGSPILGRLARVRNFPSLEASVAPLGGSTLEKAERAKGAEKASRGEMVVQKGVPGDSVSSLPP